MNIHTMKDLANSNDAKPVKVLNVLTEEYQVFMNGYSLETNLISSIIYSTGDSSKILDSDYRDKITEEASLKYIVTKHGQKKVYSDAYNLIAYYQRDHEYLTNKLGYAHAEIDCNDWLSHPLDNS